MVLIYQYNRLETTLKMSSVISLYIKQNLLYYMAMENIRNFNEDQPRTLESEDPLATIWGIYNTEIAPTGRIDSEYSAFKNIETRILSKEITGKKGIEEAWAVVHGRLEYN